MSNDSWPPNLPDTLFEISLEYCSCNLETTICDFDINSQKYHLKSHVAFPQSVSNALMKAIACIGVRKQHFGMFASPEVVSWKRLYLDSVHDLTDSELHPLLAHQPVELRISSVSLSKRTLQVINDYGQSLALLSITKSPHLFSDCKLANCELGCRIASTTNHPSQVFQLPLLQSLTMHDINLPERILPHLFHGLSALTKLDLSNCHFCVSDIADGIVSLRNLQMLRLHNVPLHINGLENCFNVIIQLQSLRVLDIGQSMSEVPHMYPGNVTSGMELLLSGLPLLTHLDISGTNLAGKLDDDFQLGGLRGTMWGLIVSKGTNIIIKQEFPLPGFQGRHFEFLGLLNCADDACFRENLPAKKIAGSANEDQVILSVKTYVDCPNLLLRASKKLNRIITDGNCTNPCRALQAILCFMKMHLTNRLLQIFGSASLFYIVRDHAGHITTRLKRNIISVLLDIMENHIADDLVLRNSCVTLCNLQLPLNVMFCYKRIAEVLLRVFLMADDQHNANTNSDVQLLAINMLNSLAFQVDNGEKLLLGQLGLVEAMLKVISCRRRLGLCDAVMLASWSMLWNMTDESDVNCRCFIDNRGLQAFTSCVQTFPENVDLLQNMTGLLGNVAEVEFLRTNLMEPEYISVFSNLLRSADGDFEVSYNTCGVLANLLSDGKSSWSVSSPSRRHVMNAMVVAISKWRSDTKICISYRTFIPILRLVRINDIPAVQYWAVWALSNLTKVCKKILIGSVVAGRSAWAPCFSSLHLCEFLDEMEKEDDTEVLYVTSSGDNYCPMLMREGGLLILEKLCEMNSVRGLRQKVQRLAHMIIERCKRVSAGRSVKSCGESSFPVQDSAAERVDADFLYEMEKEDDTEVLYGTSSGDESDQDQLQSLYY